MSSRFRGSALAVLVSGSLVFALACSGGGKPSVPSDDSTSSSSASPGVTPSASNGGSKSGGSTSGQLRLLGSDPVTLDPALLGDSNSAGYAVEIFSGLVGLDKDLKIIPDLAESWDTSSDGTVYTFHLRKNAMFQDGTPVTATNVKYSLERTAKLGRTTSETAEAYLGDIVGVSNVIANKSDTISGVEVVDANTLKITIDASKPYFLAKLSYPTAYVVEKKQVDADPQAWWKKPIGTGPYKLAAWDVNQRIELQANPNYVLGAPSIKDIVYNLAGGSSLTQYENGDIDVSGVGLDDLARAQDKRDPLSKDYTSAPTLSMSYLAFNNQVKPFDDPNVRLAFALAIDKKQITKTVFKDALPPANSLMMPGLPGYDSSANAQPFNVKKAKDLLAQSKYKDAKGLGPITLTEIGGGATASDDNQAIVEMLKKNLGVDVQIEESEEGAFYDDLDQHKLQMWALGWSMDYPDPEDIIDLLFNSKSRQNIFGYANPKVDALTVQARTETDVTKRLQLYDQAEQLIMTDAAVIPMYFGDDHYVVKPYVQNFVPGPIQIPFLKDVNIKH